MYYFKELAICVLVILIIIGFDIVFDNHFGILKDSIEEKIAKLEKTIENNEKNDDEVKDLYNKWFELESKASYYVEHDELEKISLRISVVKKSLEIDEKEEAQNALEEIKFLINHIYDKDKLKFKNIF